MLHVVCEAFWHSRIRDLKETVGDEVIDQSQLARAKINAAYRHERQAGAE
jgi:hypothetical protein